MPVTWDSRLSAAVGDKTAKALHAAFGFETVGDLLLHYPRAYVARGETSSVRGLVAGEHTTVIGRVVAAKQHPYTDRRTQRTAYRLEVLVELSDGRLGLTFFDRNQRTADWRARQLPPGLVATFEGKAEWDRFHDRWQLVHPELEEIEGGDEAVARQRQRLTALQPIYPASKKMSSFKIETAVRVALEQVDDVPDLLPPEIRLHHGLVSGKQALTWIHQPDGRADKATAEKRLRFEEAYVTQTVLAQRRAELRALDAQPRAGRPGGLLDRFDERLPFTLTAGQRDVGERIMADLAAGHPMHTLLQGEVGSGKTVVALRAMLRVIDSGGQAALLAPTEVLAQQHHRSITALLGDLAAGGMLGGADDGTRVALLTGSMGATARKQALLDAASGAAGIVVGTHALLEERVQFADLGLVVVDEQHRFGVEQRAALAAKAGETPPHVLVMTATPIPRTVAMTVFGDLETATLAELPAGRAPIQTTVVPIAEQPAWVDRVWARVREEAERAHQTYVVCPRIGDEAGPRSGEPDEEEPPADVDPEETADDKVPPAAVEEVAPALAADALEGLRVQTLHGRLAPDRKDAVMRAFAAGEIDVLVSTTVIEVGVDVANATAMVILDADRFGVSQLHQLRGRVGRGGLPGLCLLLTRAAPGSPARTRLEAVASTTDGFALSQLDLEQRREGDVLGTTQSGRRSSLRLLSVIRDGEVIAEAREAAETTVRKDPRLSGHPALASAVRRLAESQRADFLAKA
ncbi:MAG: ATP-dependent DNA helicase RecG [Nocardioidaceae bacterium]